MKYSKILTAFLFIAFAFFSCSNRNKFLTKNPEWKNFTPPPNFVYIPSGKLKLNETKELTVQGFFMLSHEVSNIFYNEFLAYLKKNNQEEKYQIAKRQPEYWYSQPFEKTYDEHPAYNDYPVVTISKQGAELYCEWLEEIWSEKYPDFLIEVRLPVEYEWVYAARGGHDFAPYPWGGYYYRNAKGQYLANFKKMEGGNITYDRKNDKYEVVRDALPKSIINLMSPVQSYIPNDYGLYNMSGNVAEMVSTNSLTGGYRTKGGCFDSTARDIQIEGRDEFEGWTEPSKFIGFRPVISVSLKK